MRLWVTLLALCVSLTACRGKERLAGNWQGYWIRAGDSLLVSLNVQPDKDTGHYTATFGSDRLRVSGIPFNEVRVQGCCDVTMVLRGDRTTMEFTGTLKSDSLSGVFKEGTSEGRFAYSRVPAVTPSLEEKDITFPSGAVTLAGSLLLPMTGDALPGVVFLQGSGAEGRWASHYLAAQFANHGIAALIFDKRGVGSSTGDWRKMTTDDLAADGTAAVARLRQEPRIDPKRIGLHGHSQGGTLAPLVAARTTGVAFIIGSAAAGVPTDSTELFSILNSIYPSAASAEDSASAKAYASELIAVAYHGQPRAHLDSLATSLKDRPWFFALPPPGDTYWSFSRDFAQYKPLEWWVRVRVPVLLIYGAADQRVPAMESSARIAGTLRKAGNADVTVKILPDADHTFRLPPGSSGWPVTAPGYIPTLLDWLARR